MSTVILDTITGKSTATTITIGSTPVVSASANSMTIRGEGTAQTSIQQGLIKGWINFGTGSATNRDSFNHSSITDNATGDFSPVMSTAMSNINYSQTASMSRATDANCDSINTNNTTGGDVAPTTTTYRFGALQFGTGGVDVTYVNFQIAGDLA